MFKYVWTGLMDYGPNSWATDVRAARERNQSVHAKKYIFPIRLLSILRSAFSPAVVYRKKEDFAN